VFLLLLLFVNGTVIIRFLSTVLRNVLYAVPFSGALGLSFLLSTLHDFMFFVNMHIFWLYTAMARLYNVQLRLLSWLWLIFRGKRRNEEKKRIESCEYSVDQLVLSTMAFAVVVFLLPTVGIYYLLFLFAMMFVLVFRTFFKLVNAMINSAPWYGLWCFLCQRAKAISVGVKVEPLPPLPNVPSVTLISLSVRTLSCSQFYGFVSHYRDR
jgi:phosphatidylinositol glycan class Q protein